MDLYKDLLVRDVGSGGIRGIRCLMTTPFRREKGDFHSPAALGTNEGQTSTHIPISVVMADVIIRVSILAA